MNYTSAPISHPLISLTACRNCGGVGERIINGVVWRCFNCAGAGTVATYGPADDKRADAARDGVRAIHDMQHAQGKRS